MILIFHIVAVLLSLIIGSELASYISCIIPVLYIMIMGMGAFTGGADISLIKLKEQLSLRWNHADELAIYMRKYWYALWYVMSATSRQNNCIWLSIFSAFTGVYYFLSSKNITVAIVLCVCAVLLYLMATRVNRPLSTFKFYVNRYPIDGESLTEFRLAVTSLVAFSELFPDNENYKFIADRVLRDDVSFEIVKNWRKSQKGSY